MSDSVDDEMIYIPTIEASSDEPEPEPTDEREVYLRLIRDTTADTFSRMSYFLRDLHREMPPDARPSFQEIIGAVLIAHSEVVRDALTFEGVMFMDSIAYRLAERAVEAIREHRRERALAEPPNEELTN